MAALRAVFLLALVLVAGCAGGSTPTAMFTVEPATFDIAAVRANFADECEDPIVLDELFCEQVDIARMSAEGNILHVPTSLHPSARDQAEVICDQIVIAHLNAEGVDLGFEYIGVLDKDGGNAAACSL